MPQLLDPNFERTVVLLVQHDSNGSFGLVLNRRVDVTVDALCSQLGIRWRGPSSEDIHWGGPVQPNTGWVLFDERLGPTGLEDEEEDVTRVSEGVAFAGSLHVLKALAQAPPDDVRLFLGYAGWGPGQLEDELAEGHWLLAPLAHDVVFGVEPEEMWDAVMRRLGVDPATLVATRGIH